MAQQIVDLPVSELQTANENDKGANPSDQNIKQNYSFWGRCSNCGRFGQKFWQCGKYGYGCNTPPSGQKTIYLNLKQHPLQYLQQCPMPQVYRMYPFHLTFKFNQMGQHCSIQQLVNAMKVSQTAFKKTVENLNEIAEGTKMIKQQNKEIANVNKRIYNK